MHRFKTKKKDAKGIEGPPVPPPPQQKESSGGIFNWGKSTPAPEPAPQLDLTSALPSTDDFRTSLLMPKLADRFSILQAELAAAAAAGNNTNNTDNPLVLSQDESFKRPFANGGLADIAETSSIHESIHSSHQPQSQNRLTTLSADSGTSAENDSIMNRARPTEGNVLFGGRQKVYKIPSGRASEDDREGGSGGMGGRVYYDDDVPASTFRQRKKEFEDQYETNNYRSTVSSNNSESITRSSTAATSINSRNGESTAATSTVDSGASSPAIGGGFSVAAALAKPRRPLYEQAAEHQGPDKIDAASLNRSRAASPTSGTRPGEKPVAPLGLGFGGFNFGFDENKSGNATPALESEESSGFFSPFGRPVSPIGKFEKQRKGSFNEEAFHERLKMQRVELSRAASPPPQQTPPARDTMVSTDSADADGIDQSRISVELRKALEDVGAGDNVQGRQGASFIDSGSEYDDSLYDGRGRDRLDSTDMGAPKSPYGDMYARKDSSAFPMDKLPTVQSDSYTSPNPSIRGPVSPILNENNADNDSPTLPPQGLSVLVRQHLRADSKASSIYAASTYSRISRIESNMNGDSNKDSIYSTAQFEDHWDNNNYYANGHIQDRTVSPESMHRTETNEENDRRDTLKGDNLGLDKLQFDFSPPMKSDEDWQKEEKDGLNDLPAPQPSPSRSSPARSPSPTSIDWEAELEQRRRMVEENIRSLSGSPVPGEPSKELNGNDFGISKKGLGLLNEAKLRAQGSRTDLGKAKKMFGMGSKERSRERDEPKLQRDFDGGFDDFGPHPSSRNGPIPRSVTTPNIHQHPAHRPQRQMTAGPNQMMGSPPGPQGHPAFQQRSQMRTQPSRERMLNGAEFSPPGSNFSSPPPPGSRSGSAMGHRGRPEFDDMLQLDSRAAPGSRRAPSSRSGSAMGHRGRPPPQDWDEMSSHPGRPDNFRSQTPGGGRQRSQGPVNRGMSRQTSREQIRPKTNGSHRAPSRQPSHEKMMGRPVNMGNQRPPTNYSTHSQDRPERPERAPGFDPHLAHGQQDFSIQPAPKTRSRGNSSAHTSPTHMSPPMRFDFSELPTPSPSFTKSPGLSAPESVPLPTTPNSIFSINSESSALPTPKTPKKEEKNPTQAAIAKLNAFPMTNSNAAKKKVVNKATIGAPTLISMTNDIPTIDLSQALLTHHVSPSLAKMGRPPTSPAVSEGSAPQKGGKRRMTTTTPGGGLFKTLSGNSREEIPDMPGLPPQAKDKKNRLKKSTSDGGGLRARARAGTVSREDQMVMPGMI